MVQKRCGEKGCKKSPRCDHPWYIKVTVNGVTQRGPVAKFAPLLDAGQLLPVTKQEAELLEAKVVTWVAKGCPPMVAPPTDRLFGPTFDDYRKRHLGKGAETPRTWKFEARWKDEPLSILLDHTAIEDYLTDRVEEDEIEHSSMNREIARLSHFLNWCMGRDYLTGKRPFFHRTNNPTGIKKEREGHRSRRLEVDEEARLIVAMANAPIMQGRLFCALDCGLRRGEMQKLHKGDVLWSHKDGVMIRIQWGNAKSRRERLVPVTTARLRDFLQTRRFVQFPFGDAQGERLESFRKSWETCRTAANLQDFHWHDLRHECGSRLAERGVPLHEIQMLMGHANIKTTQRYLNPKLTNLAASMRVANSGL